MLQFYQWGKDEFWSSLDHHFYHNFARFYTSGDQDCSVILLCHPSSIEVVVHRGNRSLELAEVLQPKLSISPDTHHDAFEVACASIVHRQLRLMLESMRKEFCWLENMRYEVGVICPVCCHGGALNYCCTHFKPDCEHWECLHLLSESELCSASQFTICTRLAAAVNNKVYVKQFAAWFGCPTEQVNSWPLKCSVHLWVGIMNYMYCNTCISLSPKTFIFTKRILCIPFLTRECACAMNELSLRLDFRRSLGSGFLPEKRRLDAWAADHICDVNSKFNLCSAKGHPKITSDANHMPDKINKQWEREAPKRWRLKV